MMNIEQAVKDMLDVDNESNKTLNASSITQTLKKTLNKKK